MRNMDQTEVAESGQQAVGAHGTVEPGAQLVGRAAVMRVDEDDLRDRVEQRDRLPLRLEAQHVPCIGGADVAAHAGLAGLRRDKAGIEQRRDEFLRADEDVV